MWGYTTNTQLSSSVLLVSHKGLFQAHTSLYIDDLASVCSDFNIQMYADDTVVYMHDVLTDGRKTDDSSQVLETLALRIPLKPLV